VVLFPDDVLPDAGREDDDRAALLLEEDLEAVFLAGLLLAEFFPSLLTEERELLPALDDEVLFLFPVFLFLSDINNPFRQKQTVR